MNEEEIMNNDPILTYTIDTYLSGTTFTTVLCSIFIIGFSIAGLRANSPEETVINFTGAIIVFAVMMWIRGAIAYSKQVYIYSDRIEMRQNYGKENRHQFTSLIEFEDLISYRYDEKENVMIIKVIQGKWEVFCGDYSDQISLTIDRFGQKKVKIGFSLV